MLESFSRAFKAVKEGAIEVAAKAYLNRKIGNFGSVTRLEIDPRAGTVSVEVQLKGEVSPIAVNVGSYTLVQKGDAQYITLRDVRASREWIGLAVEEYVAGREFKIPEAVAKLL